MKMTTRQLAHRAEQKLSTLVPSHIIKVTHNSTSGVKISAVMGGKVHEYAAGTNWTTVDMTCQQIAKDYIASKYTEQTNG